MSEVVQLTRAAPAVEVLDQPFGVGAGVSRTLQRPADLGRGALDVRLAVGDVVELVGPDRPAGLLLREALLLLLLLLLLLFLFFWKRRKKDEEEEESTDDTE